MKNNFPNPYQLAYSVMFQGEAFAKQHGLLFMETSAKTGQNVEKAFIELTVALLQNMKVCYIQYLYLFMFVL